MIFAPSYYSEFNCIADKCRHSCCIDWEICIDDEAFEKYKKVPNILRTIEGSDGGASFKLRENGRCPHLNDHGLCDIIISHGENFLCEICQNHPRFFNNVGGGKIEAGLGIVCEEACRLILQNEKPFELFKVEDFDGEDFEIGFEALPVRDRIIAAIESESGFCDTVSVLKEEFQIPEIFTFDEWLSRFLSLEILDEKWKQDLQLIRGNEVDKSASEFDRYYKRLLSYFVYRHVSASESEENLRARLGFCILSVEMIRTLFKSEPEKTLDRLIDWARRYSSEIEYSEDNTAELIFAFEAEM